MPSGVGDICNIDCISARSELLSGLAYCNIYNCISEYCILPYWPGSLAGFTPDYFVCKNLSCELYISDKLNQSLRQLANILPPRCLHIGKGLTDLQQRSVTEKTAAHLHTVYV